MDGRLAALRSGFRGLMTALCTLGDDGPALSGAFAISLPSDGTKSAMAATPPRAQLAGRQEIRPIDGDPQPRARAERARRFRAGAGETRPHQSQDHAARVVNSPSLLTGVAVCACCGIRNDPNWDNQSAGSLVLVLFLCGLPAEGQNGLQGMPYPGRDPGRNRRDQPQAACTGASATS